MNRRDYLALTGTALTTAVAGCSGAATDRPKEAEEPNEPAAGEEGSNTEAPEEETTDTDAEEQPEPEPTEEVHQPEAQSFSGSGAEVEARRPDRWGLTVVEATHTNGESNFQVSLVGGEFDDLFVNAIGEYDGETAA